LKPNAPSSPNSEKLSQTGSAQKQRDGNQRLVIYFLHKLLIFPILSSAGSSGARRDVDELVNQLVGNRSGLDTGGDVTPS
jgi:hypothetical protein